MTITAFAFGDPVTGIWGLAAHSGEFTVATFAPELEIEDSADEALLGYGGVELRFTPTGPAAPFAPAAANVDGRMQLCAVQGAIHWDGAEQEIACLGMRVTVEPPSGKLASIRAAAAWLDPEDGFALVSVRPAGGRGHDGDAVGCALLEDGRPLEVEEPRFSTAYDADGVPSRAGLELWLLGGDEDDAAGGNEDDAAGGDDQSETETETETGRDPGPDLRYPRRAAGERTGDGAEVVLPGANARADLFTWHARGIHGAGVYLLIPAP